MTCIVNVIVLNCLIISFIRLFCFVFRFLFIDIISIWFDFNRYEFFDSNINDSFSSYCFMNSLNLSSRLFVFRIFLNFFVVLIIFIILFINCEKFIFSITSKFKFRSWRKINYFDMIWKSLCMNQMIFVVSFIFLNLIKLLLIAKNFLQYCRMSSNDFLNLFL